MQWRNKQTYSTFPGIACTACIRGRRENFPHSQLEPGRTCLRRWDESMEPPNNDDLDIECNTPWGSPVAAPLRTAFLAAFSKQREPVRWKVTATAVEGELLFGVIAVPLKQPPSQLMPTKRGEHWRVVLAIASADWASFSCHLVLVSTMVHIIRSKLILPGRLAFHNKVTGYIPMRFQLGISGTHNFSPSTLQKVQTRQAWSKLMSTASIFGRWCEELVRFGLVLNACP